MTEPNDLKGELASILALSEKATPGEWVAKWSKYRKSEFLVQTAHPSNRVLATFDDDGEGAGEQSVADGELMAAAVNFLRTHEARLKRALEDAERYEFLKRNASAGFLQSGTPFAVMHDRTTCRTWEDMEREIDTARASEQTP